METINKHLEAYHIELKPALKSNAPVATRSRRSYEIIQSEPLVALLQFDVACEFYCRYSGRDLGTIKAKAGATVSGIPLDSTELTRKAMQVARALELHIYRTFSNIAPQLGYDPVIGNYDIVDAQLFAVLHGQNDGISPLNFNVHGALTEELE